MKPDGPFSAVCVIKKEHPVRILTLTFVFIKDMYLDKTVLQALFSITLPSFSSFLTYLFNLEQIHCYLNTVNYLLGNPDFQQNLTFSI